MAKSEQYDEQSKSSRSCMQRAGNMSAGKQARAEEQRVECARAHAVGDVAQR